MRLLFRILIFFAPGITFSQSFSPLTIDQTRTGTQSELSNAKILQIIDTLSLPFIEDFSTYTGVADTNKFLENGGVYVNARYPNLPPSLNAATFDGLMENGVPYDFISVPPNTHGPTDALTSKPIDLGSFGVVDSAILSFYWQKGSRHASHFPDETDSIRLQFKDNAGTWSTVWAEVGDTIISISSFSNFIFQEIILDSAKYFHSGFQFRFESFGRQTGQFDVWSIDHIFLDTNRTIGSHEIEAAFSDYIPSLLTPYSSMPFDHFLSAPGTWLNPSVCIPQTVYSFGQPINVAPEVGSLSEVNRSLFIDSINPAAAQIGPLHIGDTIATFCWAPDLTDILDDTATLNDGQNILFKTKFRFNHADIFESNDTVTGETFLGNYYAYDDGTAELGAGIDTKFGYFAYEYDLAIQDTLRYIEIHFPKMNEDRSGESLLLMVWSDLDGINGSSSTIVLSQSFGLLSYENDTNDKQLNSFVSFPVNAGGGGLILPPGRFYIGYQQFTDDLINVGFDINTSSETKAFIDISGGWQVFNNPSDSTKGSFMVRPRFGALDPVAGLENPENVEIDVNIYPNPTQDILHIDGILERIELTDLTGKTHYGANTSIWSNRHTISTSNLARGVYLVHLYKGGIKQVKRIIRE